MGPLGLSTLMAGLRFPGLDDYMKVLQEFQDWSRDKSSIEVLLAVREIHTTYQKALLAWMKQTTKFSKDDFIKEIEAYGQEESVSPDSSPEGSVPLSGGNEKGVLGGESA